MVYFDNEKYKKAFNFFEKALDLKQKYNITFEIDHTYYYLADLYEKKEEDEIAFEYYVKALEFMMKYASYEHVLITVKWIRTFIRRKPNRRTSPASRKTFIRSRKKRCFINN